MKITHIEPLAVHVNHRGDWSFVLVHTDAGLTGLGEATPLGGEQHLFLAAVEQFSHQLAGRDPRYIQAIWTAHHRHYTSHPTRAVLSAIEQALWDILGQHLGVPIRTLLGGRVRDRIRLYANINRHITDRTPTGFARAARQAVDEGFTAIKVAPFDELNRRDRVRTGPRAAWRTGVERVAAVRAAIGDDIELMVDCHARMEASEAIIVGRALADCNLMWYEEPVSHTLPDQLRRVRAALPMPIASCETLYGIEEFRPFLTGDAVDVIMPDIKYDGGLMETVRIAEAARMGDVLVAPHNPAGPVATAATAQAMATVGNFLILEYAWGEVDWRAGLLDPPERIEDGYLLLPEHPGLGHRLNEVVADQHRLV